MLKHQDARFVLFSKLNNAGAHQMGYLLIHRADLAPEVGVVLLALCNDASLLSVACNASQQFLPKAGYLSPSSNEGGSEDRTFNGLDGAYGEMFVEIEIDGADPCLCIRGDLLRDFGWTAELPLQRRV